MIEGLKQRMDHARQIAKEAGAELMSYYGRLDTFDEKGEIDFVTAADRASEDLLVASIGSVFPDDAILAEEGTEGAGTSGWQWIIDPLDGTTNFLHTFPLFMVSIGLLKDGVRAGAVCYGPVMDELFEAALGGGAMCNGTPISVSRTDSLKGALLATGFPYNRREIVDELLAPVRRSICLAHGIRRGGAATYDLCFLACGRLDGYYERGLRPWDVAAGTLIIEEAGGIVTGCDGGPFTVNGPDLLASNGLIHEEVRLRVVHGDTA